VKDRGVPLGYVEGLNDARTLLADYFNILLHHELLQQCIPLFPFTMPTVGIDMPCLADIDESAPPSNRTMLGVGQRSERVIRAGDHETPKDERRHRHRHKSTRRGREAGALRIWYRHEKCALRNKCGTMSPMSYQETGEAMSHQHGRRRTGLHRNIQRTNPILAYRTVPISQIHALPLGMVQLPERLPMLLPGVANTGQD